jgi:hypothetical protein
MVLEGFSSGINETILEPITRVIRSRCFEGYTQAPPMGGILGLAFVSR